MLGSRCKDGKGMPPDIELCGERATERMAFSYGFGQLLPIEK